jgi:hypothetical protein
LLQGIEHGVLLQALQQREGIEHVVLLCIQLH